MKAKKFKDKADKITLKNSKRKLSPPKKNNMVEKATLEDYLWCQTSNRDPVQTANNNDSNRKGRPNVVIQESANKTETNWKPINLEI